jgi:hypothetical protein
MSLPARGRIALTRGELASQMDDFSSAQRHFVTAAEIFDDLGEPAEKALGVLFQVRHYLRHHRPDLARARAVELLPLADNRLFGKFGKAILFEVGRLCVAGEGTVDSIAEAIGEWRQAMPWFYSSR